VRMTKERYAARRTRTATRYHLAKILGVSADTFARVRMPPGLRPLRHRDFALYCGGLTISQIGEWMETTTTAWLIYELTGSPVLLGLWGGTRAAATILFGLVAGTLADRFPRRRLMLGAQVGLALISLALFGFVATESVTIVHIYILSAVAALLSIIDSPARRSTYPTLVPRSELQNAATLNAMAFRTSKLVGPAIAGVVIAAFGPAAAYLVNAVSAMAIVAAVLLIRAWPLVAPATTNLWRQTIDGLRYTRRTQPLGQLLMLEAGHSLFGVNTVLVTIVAKDMLGAGAVGLGFLLGALGAGALLGTVWLIMHGDIEHKGRWMLLGAAMYTMFHASLAVSRWFELTVLLMVGIGCADAFWSTIRTAIFQMQATDAYRGRTLSALTMVGRGSTQASQLVTGAGVSLLGTPLAILAGAGIVGIVFVAVNARDASVRTYRTPLLPTAVEAATESTAP
jgi:MFS family permease